jgi:sodium/potassium-transporting ATPase subunit alpha
MLDPPHREVPEALERCRGAGIRVIMITGDHPLTALAIARKIALAGGTSAGAGPAIALIDGDRVDALDDASLRRLLTPTKAGEPEPVFARMAPRHKMRVVSMLKDMGEIVAVTGDGVNDVPALKKADIGVAMGVAGTDVAKETADMVLLDDNFSTIVNAIEEGRAVYANIRKFVTYVLSSNVPEVVPYLAYGLFGAPLALTIPQVLAVDLGTDMVPALGLGAEPPQAGLMTLPPRSRTERLLNIGVLLRSYAFLGAIEAATAMTVFFWSLHSQGWVWGMPVEWGSPIFRTATTATFAAIVITQIANVFACRSDELTPFRLPSNRLIGWGVATEVLLLVGIVYTPLGNQLLGTAPLAASTWLPMLAGAAVLLAADAVWKRLRARPGCGPAPEPSGRTHAT